MFFFDDEGVWLKGNLHTHTTRSDGKNTPENTVKMYQKLGYDFLAITDHFVYHKNDEILGMPIISGVEYNLSQKKGPTRSRIHIVGIGMERDPEVENDIWYDVQSAIDAIIESKGIAIWGHPAWSLNSAEDILKYKGISGVEIYNTISGKNGKDRAYSGVVVDSLLMRDRTPHIYATDDLHNDEIGAFIMVKARGRSHNDILSAIRKGDFYASTGPEIYNINVNDGVIEVECSPAVKAAFISGSIWAPNRIKYGEDSTSFSYKYMSHEEYIRIEITDKEGKTAYSQPIFLKEAKRDV